MMKKLPNDLRTACDLSLRLPKVGYVSGYVLMIEDYTINEDNQELKVYPPVRFGSRIFRPNQLKLLIYAKVYLAVHFVIDTFANIIWG